MVMSFPSLFFCSDPMRITKKFAGSSCIGKQVFIPRDGPVDDKELAEIQDGLKVLEKTFMSKIDCQHRQQSYQMAGLAGSQGAVIAAALQSQASAAMGLSMPSPYMNSTMDGTGMGLSSSNHGGNYPPELLAAFHPHHAATMSMPLPMHPMLAGTGGIHGLPGGPSLAGYPNMYYAFPPPSHAHHPQQQPSMGSRKGSRKGSSSSDSSDSGPDANSAYHMAMHANEAAIREMKANLPTTNGTSRQLSNHSNLMMNNSSSSSSSSHGMSAGGGGGGAPIYRSRQSYTSAELFGQQYPTTLEHMAFLSSENLEASRKKRSSDGSNILSGGSQLHVQVGQKHNSHPKGSSSSKGKKGSTGRVIPADPIDLDASSLLLNFFQSTTTIPEENKSDTSNGTSSHEVTFASGSKNEHEHDGEGGGGDIHDENKKKKAKMGGSSKSTTADENEQPTTTTTTGTEHISHVVPDKQEAPSTSTSDGKLNGSRGKYKSSTSSGSGRTSNGSGTGSGDGDNDDSASTFSDAGDADASNSISGRSSSLSSDRSDNSDYSSPDEKEQKNQQRNRIDYEEKPKPVSSSVEVDLESRSRMVQEGGDNMNETTEPQPQQ